MQWFGSKDAKPADQGSGDASAKGAKPQSTVRRKSRKRVGLFCLHILLVGCVLVGLAFLNQAWGLDRLLNSRWEAMRAIWLPILFLLAYLLCWLSWWAVRQLGPDRLSGEFPDLDKAWSQGRQLLADNGIDLRTTPLFLVLGQPEGGIELFFAASHWPFQVRFAASGSEPSLHVYGNREAVFVACGSSSLLAAVTRSQVIARQVDSPSETAVSLPSDRLQSASRESASGESLGAAILASEADRALVPAPSGTTAFPRASLVGEDSSGSSRLPVTLWPTQDRDLTERLTARLRSLCRSIAHDRQPLVPVNGVLALLPLFATDSPELARTVAQACRTDLQEIRESLGAECPRVALLCDLQRVPGFDALVAAFPDGPSQQWVLGRTFPLMPDLDSARWPGMIEQGLHWLTDSLWPSAIYPLMQPGPADWQEGEPVMQANQRCFRLMEEGWRRMRLVPEIVVRSFQMPSPARPLFGGFALAATGTDSLRQQGFVAGVLRWLVEAQDYVGWTEQAIREDAVCHRWTVLGSLVLACVFALLVVLSIGLLW